VAQAVWRRSRNRGTNGHHRRSPGSGRWLDASEFADENWSSILTNETLARQLFGEEDPLGQLVGPDWTEDGFQVVGVVGDIVGGSPTRPAPPAFFYPIVANTPREMSVLVKAAGDPYALLLEAVGIYGVMSFSVARRSKELGVRLALGASRASVMRLVVIQGARLTLPGVLVGLMLALASGRVLGSLLYEVSALDPLTYGVVAAVLAVVSMAATFVPAFRATRVDPIGRIRDE
jgi:hypothetical protein